MNSSTYTNTMSLSQPTTVPVSVAVNNLSQANVSQEYYIKKVIPVDQEIVDFLFSLGCYEGETITLMSVLSESYVVSINGARYSLSSELAELILI